VYTEIGIIANLKNQSEVEYTCTFQKYLDGEKSGLAPTAAKAPSNVFNHLSGIFFSFVHTLAGWYFRENMTRAIVKRGM